MFRKLTYLLLIGILCISLPSCGTEEPVAPDTGQEEKPGEDPGNPDEPGEDPEEPGEEPEPEDVDPALAEDEANGQCFVIASVVEVTGENMQRVVYNISRSYYGALAYSLTTRYSTAKGAVSISYELPEQIVMDTPKGETVFHLNDQRLIDSYSVEDYDISVEYDADRRLTDKYRYNRRLDEMEIFELKYDEWGNVSEFLRIDPYGDIVEHATVEYTNRTLTLPVQTMIPSDCFMSEIFDGCWALYEGGFFGKPFPDSLIEFIRYDLMPGGATAVYTYEYSGGRAGLPVSVLVDKITTTPSGRTTDHRECGVNYRKIVHPTYVNLQFKV